LFNKIFSVLLIVIILATAGIIIWFAILPNDVDNFTEFYMLGTDGKAQDYPQVMTMGENISVILGIVNKENRDVNYRIHIKQGDVYADDIKPGLLANGQKWEQQINLVMAAYGEEKVEFWLYKDESSEPKLSLNLKVWVK
jgi:uncharacterized membrane protein